MPGPREDLSARSKLIEGTGRFAGIIGTIEFTGHCVDVGADGNLGDLFATGRASYVLKK